MQLEWNLYYERWVIDDGQQDLRVGETFEWFAIAFWTFSSLVRSQERAKSADGIADYRYRVAAELVYRSEKACVIDFGLGAVVSPASRGK
jgi:hypothetical protein